MTKKPAGTLVTISYYSADLGAYVRHEGFVVRSGAGYGPGPDYGVLYRLTDGRYLGGVRHTNCGDLMTDVSYATTAKAAMPALWT